MTNELPKLGFFKFSLYVMDLFLVACDDEEAVREPKVRIVWHILFFSMIIGLIIISFVRNIMDQQLIHNPLYTYIFRLSGVIFIIYLIIILATLAYRHYVYLLSTEKDLRFENITFFYFTTILLFSSLYVSFYTLDHSLFIYKDPIFIPSDLYAPLSIKIKLYLFLDFIAYSMCVITNINYPRIMSSSVLVSIFNVIQVIFGIVIVVLFIATFIQKTDHKRNK